LWKDISLIFRVTSCFPFPKHKSRRLVWRSYFPPLLNLALDARDYLHVLAIVPEAQRVRYTLDRKLNASRTQREVPAWNHIRVVHLLQSRFYALSEDFEKRLSATSCLSVHHPVCVKQLRSHWTESQKIWPLRIYRKSVENIKFSLKSDTNNGHLAKTYTHTHTHTHTYIYIYIWYIYDNASLNTSGNEKFFRQNL